MRNLLLLALLIAPIELPLGCSAEDAAPERAPQVVTGAIKGGYVSQQDTAVVGLVHLDDYAVGICSGSLIAPNLVLTARHCVAPTLSQVQGGVDCGRTYFGTTYSPSSMLVSTSYQLSPNASYLDVAEILVPEDTNFCGNDIALVILDEPVLDQVATPLTPRVDELLVGDAWRQGRGESYSAIGFGVTGDDNIDSGVRRRLDDLDVACVHEECPSYAGISTNEWVGDSGVCQGDSGGPAIDEFDRVIGVASRGAADCSFPIYASVFAWSEWIIEGAAYAAQLGGYPPTAWARGLPTHPAWYAAVGGACQHNGDCEGGYCISGVCSRPCDERVACPAAFGCNGGRCMLHPVGAECAADDDCQGGLCRGGVCSRACDLDVGCPDGWACDGSCVLHPIGAACDSASECPGGGCVDGYCTRACGAEAPCPAAYECDSGDRVCMLYGVGDTCETGADCRSGLCEAGYCTRACDGATDCPTGYACGAAGSCLLIEVGASCLEDAAACGEGVCAEAGYCTRGCDDLAPCAEGYLCDQGMCALIDVGLACSEDAECRGGVCAGGLCTRACHEQAPCPDGYRCGEQGTCAPIRAASEGCAAGHGPTAPWLLVALLALLAAPLRRRGARAPGGRRRPCVRE
ncbi:MAG: hypothetical protein CSA66_01820 [Proteobacteria bacterium]|nr:MAG: hypothetical protein CSA66_01820 [Pseudomonadota bacterium]